MYGLRRVGFFAVALFAAGVLSGCSGYDEGYEDGFYDGSRYPDSGMVTLFFIDKDGYSLGNIPYYCVEPDGRTTEDYVTAPNGEFSFYPGERCTFDFYGYEGTPADPLFIVDDLDNGKGDIPYVCEGGDEGRTYPSGSFDYLPDDMCTFYF